MTASEPRSDGAAPQAGREESITATPVPGGGADLSPPCELSVARVRPVTEVSGWTGRRQLRDLAALDEAISAAIAAQGPSSLDGPLRRLSKVASYSVLWLGVAAALAVFGGGPGRRAAARGLAAIAVTSALVNLGLKALHDRERPGGEGDSVPPSRRVRRPTSSSFPSGHSASGFAFATAVADGAPVLAVPLQVLATAVAYSRVHVGVHYPSDVVAGALVGSASGLTVARILERLVAHRRRLDATDSVGGAAALRGRSGARRQ